MLTKLTFGQPTKENETIGNRTMGRNFAFMGSQIKRRIPNYLLSMFIHSEWHSSNHPSYVYKLYL